MSCHESARKTALECAGKLEYEARGMAILRSVDATEAAKWLREIAAAIREACGPDEPADPAEPWLAAAARRPRQAEGDTVSALERWRERCAQVYDARALPLEVRQGIELARVIGTITELPERAIDGIRMASINVPAMQQDGLRLALTWLREEVERGE